MSRLAVLLFALGSLLLTGCGTRSSSSVQPVTGVTSNPPAVRPAVKTAAAVLITENDITDRPYQSLGDISVTVSKWTIFDADPTQAKVAEALKEKAAGMGADAVILTRYGTVGIGAFTWGKMEGKGRAVVFKQ